MKLPSINFTTMRSAFYIFSFLFLLPFFLSSEVRGQQTGNVKISLELKNVSLKDALKDIEKITPFIFLAKAEDIETERNVTINVTNTPVHQVLEKILGDRKLMYREVDGNIFIKRWSVKQGSSGQRSPGSKAEN